MADFVAITPETLKRVGADSIQELPEFAWPGGYPLYYFDGEGNNLCAGCARKNEEYSSPIVGADIHEEGPPISCDQCSTEIESAYGDPEVEV